MSYILNTPNEQRQMLAALRLNKLDDLFTVIPETLRRKEPLQLPPALTELELTQHLQELAQRNQSCADRVCFFGGGCYDHFIPAVVDMIGARSEFYTAYTPYQAEASQGSLQAFFEYQTLICQLTGMDASNASLYDGGSAATEAAFMAMGVTRRHGRIVVSQSLHPEYRQILATYLCNLETELITVPAPGGTTDIAALRAALTSETACVIVQHPNFFGCLEEVEQLGAVAHDAGALFVVVFDPISLGLLKRPGDYGADVAVAEGQCLGNPMQFGGPYLGILTCREPYVRKMPGRIVGQTTDRQGRRCYVLTLQTREQHIRREKATSNICTNQGLLALRAAVYLSALGPAGLREVAELCTRKAHYAADRLSAVAGLSLKFDRPFFKEFVVQSHTDVNTRLRPWQAAGFFAGVPLDHWYPELKDCFLTAVTEKRTRREIDWLVEVAQS